MEKYLVTIEFRYSDVSKDGESLTHDTKKVTIGVYDDFDSACIDGNGVLEMLESKFALNTYTDGRTASKERLSKNGGPFGWKKYLVANNGYLKTPFDFYLHVETLKYDSIEDAISIATKARGRVKTYHSENQ